MNGERTTGVEDIVRRNIAALRAKENLTQQGLADEMLLRGIGWTRETVAQVETTNRRIGLTEAIAVAACLDVPLARLTATGADSVAVGDGRWSTAYLAAAVAGTADDMFPPESYAADALGAREDQGAVWAEEAAPVRAPDSGTSPMELERRRRSRDRRQVEPTGVVGAVACAACRDYAEVVVATSDRPGDEVRSINAVLGAAHDARPAGDGGALRLARCHRVCSLQRRSAP